MGCSAESEQLRVGESSTERYLRVRQCSSSRRSRSWIGTESIFKTYWKLEEVVDPISGYRSRRICFSDLFDGLATGNRAQPEQQSPQGSQVAFTTQSQKQWMRFEVLILHSSRKKHIVHSMRSYRRGTESSFRFWDDRRYLSATHNMRLI